MIASQDTGPRPTGEGMLSGWRLFLVASAVYLACMIPFFVAYGPHMTTILIGPPGDNLQDFWNTWYSQKIWDAGGHGFFRTNLVRYPEGASLYYHSFSYSSLALIFLSRKMFFLTAEIPTLLALHNGVLLASIYLSAIGAFYLARRFTRYVASALLAGFIFGFSPFHMAHFLTHMHVATTEFIPFFVLCFLLAAESGRWAHLAGAIAFGCLSALSSWYYLVYTACFLVFYYVYQAVVQRKLVLRRQLWAAAGTLAGMVLLLSPILVPMTLEGWGNPDLYPGGRDEYVADVLGYFVFGPNHLLAGIGRSVYAQFSGFANELGLYLGLVNLALFGWAFWNRKRQQSADMTFLLSGMLLFMLLSSGPFLHVYGRSVMPLPTAVLDYLPFANFMRAATRAMVMVYLLFGIGAGVGLDLLFQWCRERGRSQLLWVAPVCLLALLDFYPAGLTHTTVTAPRGYAVLAADTDTDFGILDLPRGYLQGNAYMFFQTFHHYPIVSATLSRNITYTLMDNLETKDMAAQKRQLTEKKVKYIVIHTDPFSIHNPGEQVNQDAYTNTYPVIRADKNSLILRVY